VYIDASDVRAVDDPDFFGFAPRKWCGLKYAGPCFVDEVVCGEGGEVKELRCTMGGDNAPKPRGFMQWVPGDGSAIRCELRMYGPLFTVPEVDDERWEQQLNSESEQVLKGALVDPSLRVGKSADVGAHFQFERLGYFVVDEDSTEREIVLNRAVELKASASGKVRKAESGGAPPGLSRKAEQQALADKKAALSNVRAEDLFKPPTCELYSEWAADGVPIKGIDGEPVSKSAAKKCAKEIAKHAKLHANRS